MRSLFAPWNEQQIVVTGATSGIGFVIVEALLEQGANVFGVGRNLSRLEELANRYPKQLHMLQADLLDLKMTRDVLPRAKQELGVVTGLICAAGAIEHQDFGATDDGAWARQLDLNLRVPTILLEEALKVMEPHSSAVVLGSTLAAHPIVTSAAYSAAKAGLEAVVKVAAISGAKQGLRVNLLHPGVVDTPMIRADRPDGHSEQARLEELAALHLLGRIAQPDELAEVVLDILKWTFATGSIVTVDGGLSVRS